VDVFIRGVRDLLEIIDDRISELEQSQQVLGRRTLLGERSRFGSGVSQGMLNWTAACATKHKSSDSFIGPWIV